MKIYTKTGDNGTTSLLSGKRVSKSDYRIDAYGTVDELNSWIGLLGELPVLAQKKSFIKGIQDRLFTIGASLAASDSKIYVSDLKISDIEALEKEMDTMEGELEPLRHFILPGGSQEIAFAHVARTVCRRAERLSVALSSENQVEELVIQYLNRLSDFLFMLARWLAKAQQAEELKWLPRKTE
jgi:cob(I)alamin adenosyltransferase